MDKTLAIFLSLSVFSVFGAETFGHGPLSSKLTGVHSQPFISNDFKGFIQHLSFVSFHRQQSKGEEKLQSRRDGDDGIGWLSLRKISKINIFIKSFTILSRTLQSDRQLRIIWGPLEVTAISMILQRQVSTLFIQTLISLSCDRNIS